MQGGLVLAVPPGEMSFRDLLAAGVTTPAARGGLASAALLVLAAVLVARRPALAAVAALGAVATLGLSGHAATAAARWLAAPALVVHAGLAALWAGALLPLRSGVTHT